MTFHARLKQAMSDLNINQKQVCDLTGKGKSSISQYLSGKQIPSEKTQREMATAMGLDPEYFERQDEVRQLKHLAERNGVIQRLDPREAARLMRVGYDTITKGLQQGVFPWGYAIKTSDKKWTYFINARRFAEIEGIEL